MCAAGTLFRDGHVCTECLDGHRFADLLHGCYRDSRTATVPLAISNRRGATSDAVLRRADALVVLSERSRGVYESAGVDPQRLHVVPNFAEVPAVSPPQHVCNGRWLFAGRLTPEKGLVELLRSWPAGEPLDVVGDGPQRAQADAIAPPGVRFLGALDRDTLRATMPTYLGLIFPSRWFESAVPLTYIEALSAGVPTIATEGSCAADDVLSHSLGATVPTDPATDDLLRALDQVRAAGTRLRSLCRESFAHRFPVHRWSTSMTSIYETTSRP
jgi:glycosyltransferase involved in cell wall biosynthesis